MQGTHTIALNEIESLQQGEINKNKLEGCVKCTRPNQRSNVVFNTFSMTKVQGVPPVISNKTPISSTSISHSSTSSAVLSSAVSGDPPNGFLGKKAQERLILITAYYRQVGLQVCHLPKVFTQKYAVIF
jgi:hypothetical protein